MCLGDVALIEPSSAESAGYNYFSGYDITLLFDGITEYGQYLITFGVTHIYIDIPAAVVTEIKLLLEGNLQNSEFTFVARQMSHSRNMQKHQN